MNKIICFLTGGHRYKSADLECKFDDEGMVRFNNHCCKCGKKYDVSIPINQYSTSMRNTSVKGEEEKS